jgi:poly-beta-1,6-N-acetyl-D-glucosamine biosynthesis protein PgaD
MADKLIINARRHLGWPRRILSDATTVGLWALWIYLWLPVFHKIQQVIRLRLHFEPAAAEVLETVEPIDFSNSVFLLIGTCAMLLLWTLLPKGRITTGLPAATLEDCADHFRLPVESLTEGRGSRITVVHHDDAGAIVRIECKS